MLTYAAFKVLHYNAVVVTLALAACALGRRGSGLRRAATRVAVTFGVFALAAAYVWLKLGPEIDHRLAVRDHPPLTIPKVPKEIEI